MQYLINSHFRMELNVSKDQAVPRLSDFMTKDEKMINEKLMQNDAEL